ncbi:MAG TPA: hypothetical protein VGL23_07320 [Chloroflexota bacterium]
MPASSGRAIARYLVGLRPVLGDACAARDEWVRRLGLLSGGAHSGEALRVARGSGRLGCEFGQLFGQTRSRIELLSPPPECDLCHAAARAWAHALLGSCQALAEVGRSRRLDGLRVAQERLADARSQAGQFNDEYARLSRALRRRVRIARRRHDRIPASRQPQPS